MEKNADTTSYILRDIPTDLWRRVKSTAALRGESLKEALIQLLIDYTKGSHG